MIKNYNIGGHNQKIEFNEDGIMDLTCDCYWGSLYPDNFCKGEKICKHIKQLLKENVTRRGVRSFKKTQ